MRKYIAIAAIFILAAIVVIYALFDPAEHFFPRCPFLMLTDLECPGCGSQRAIHALLNADLRAAWHSNALLLVAIPFLVATVVAHAIRHRHPRLDAALNSSAAIYVWLSAIMLWWIFRNLC